MAEIRGVDKIIHYCMIYYTHTTGVNMACTGKKKKGKTKK